MKPTKHSAIPGLIGVVSILWLALVFAAYYAGHKPFSPQVVVSILTAGKYLLVALALIMLAGGVGRCILLEVGDNHLESLGLQAAIGVGILSVVFLLVIVVLGTTPIVAWLTLGLFAALLVKQITGWVRSWVELIDTWRATNGFGKAIAVGCGLIAGFALLTSLAPALKFDSLVYHLALPLATVQAQQVGYIPENVYWGMPQLAETLYTWGMLLAGGKGGIPAATTFGWGIGVLALAGILGTAWQRYGSGGWVAVAGLMVGSTLAQGLGWGYVEWFTILYGWGVLWSLDRWSDTRELKWAIIAGVFAGFALGCKYPAGALILAGAVVLVAKAVRGSAKGSDLVLPPLMFIASALIAASPWLLKNLIATGNPLYPFGVPSGAMDVFRLEYYQSMSVWGDWRDVFLLPWRATIYGFEAAPGYAAAIGPLLLGFALVVPFGRWINQDRGSLKLGVAVPLALIGLVIWAVAGRIFGYLVQTRLYLAFVPSVALLAAAGFELLAGIRLQSVRLGRVAGSLVLVALYFNVIQTGLDVLSRDVGQVLVGYQTGQEYLARNLGEYAEVMDWTQALPTSSRVVMLWEPRGLYCQPACDSDEILDRWQSDLHRYATPTGVLSYWRQTGYTHLLINLAGERFIREEDPRYNAGEQRGLDDLLASLPAPVYSGDDYSVYPLEP